MFFGSVCFKKPPPYFGRFCVPIRQSRLRACVVDTPLLLLLFNFNLSTTAALSSSTYVFGIALGSLSMKRGRVSGPPYPVHAYDNSSVGCSLFVCTLVTGTHSIQHRKERYAPGGRRHGSRHTAKQHVMHCSEGTRANNSCVAGPGAPSRHLPMVARNPTGFEERRPVCLAVGFPALDKAARRQNPTSTARLFSNVFYDAAEVFSTS